MKNPREILKPATIKKKNLLLHSCCANCAGHSDGGYFHSIFGSSKSVINLRIRYRIITHKEEYDNLLGAIKTASQPERFCDKPANSF